LGWKKPDRFWKPVRFGHIDIFCGKNLTGFGNLSGLGILIFFVEKTCQVLETCQVWAYRYFLWKKPDRFWKPVRFGHIDIFCGKNLTGFGNLSGLGILIFFVEKTCQVLETCQVWAYRYFLWKKPVRFWKPVRFGHIDIFCGKNLTGFGNLSGLGWKKT
jgi:hypothetical protein